MHANNAAAALSRLATCAMQASDALPWRIVCRGVVDGIEAVIPQTRTPEGVRRVDQTMRRDYDATENRWVIERVWPHAVTAGLVPAPKRPAPSRKGRRRRRRQGGLRRIAKTSESRDDGPRDGRRRAEHDAFRQPVFQNSHRPISHVARRQNAARGDCGSSRILAARPGFLCLSRRPGFLCRLASCRSVQTSTVAYVERACTVAGCAAVAGSRRGCAAVACYCAGSAEGMMARSSVSRRWSMRAKPCSMVRMRVSRRW